VKARAVDQLNEALDNAEGFVGTTDQGRFDECEEAVNQVLQDIRKFSQQTKVRETRFPAWAAF
jgi:protein transport protein DSL1/ZW10